MNILGLFVTALVVVGWMAGEILANTRLKVRGGRRYDDKDELDEGVTTPNYLLTKD